MVITVDERPCGLRSAASENTVTTVGPTPIPASAIAATTPGSPPASAKAIIAASISVEEASHRAQRRNRSGSSRSEEHTSELQSRGHLVCRLLLEKQNTRR